MKVNGQLSVLALAAGMGLTLAALPASAQQRPCDSNADGMVDAIEAATCDERRFEEAAGGEEEMTQEQFGAAHPEAPGGGADLFGQVDADASGSISREEWMNWREQRFGEATEETGGQMPAADYELWEWGADAPAQ